MIARLAAIAVLLLAGPALADELVIPPVEYPKVLPYADTPEAFVPDGWKVDLRAEGDLNGDALPDVAVVMRATDPRNVLNNKGGFGPDPFDSNPRMLLIAFRQEDGRYSLELLNNTLIPRATEPERSDVFEDVDPPAISQGVFKIGLGYFSSAGGWGMGRKSYTFRHQHGGFMLIGFDSLNVERNSGEMNEVSVNYLTRKVKLTAGRIDSDAEKVRWKALPRKPLLWLSDIGDGLDYEPAR
ncbi:MAG: hypothetical protein JWP35_3700 [Caulobacter sp.]|nr:hypothetical protein [Caulobacter sp.]